MIDKLKTERLNSDLKYNSSALTLIKGMFYEHKRKKRICY